jgi:hypothetical protein
MYFCHHPREHRPGFPWISLDNLGKKPVIYIRIILGIPGRENFLGTIMKQGYLRIIQRSRHGQNPEICFRINSGKS